MADFSPAETQCSITGVDSDPDWGMVEPGGSLGRFLRRSKGALFEALTAGGPVNFSIVLSPEDALSPIDGACSAIGAAYDDLLAYRMAGNHSAVATPVMRLHRADFTGSELEKWLGKRGIHYDQLLFIDDVEEVLSLASTAKVDTIITVNPLKLPSRAPGPFKDLPGGKDDVPGARGCHASAAAARLLIRAADLVPAGRARLFASGPAAYDQAFKDAVALLRDALLDITGNLDPRLRGPVWCNADAEVLKAIDALRASE
eukprot:gnl/TRDRNA2_/TRDRNA2_196824_c0_seq1.p1 gnl/TRDRNA2_/TRDRNA2_196824_c0~~gnl/TRDRNA2_/TRDRNA2_196824_c0_seq1.p1  ORF type:complete len:293 (+),score=57.94 gnl/TRDRNA2_/TRDRNA2_196824_c0_seq1:105-881(+)